MLAWFGLFASRGPELRSDLLSYFPDFLPAPAFQLLRATVAQLGATASPGRLTLVLAFALCFASAGVVSTISALNSAYRMREDRSWLKVSAIALGLTVVLSILLLAALLLVLASGHFVDWLGADLKLQPLAIRLWKALQWPAAILFVLMSYSLIYYWGPHFKRRHWHWITPGSAFGASLWFLASLAFRVYLHFLDTYTAFYGSLAGVMILLFWLYVAGLAFLIGGEINAEIERAAAGGHLPA